MDRELRELFGVIVRRDRRALSRSLEGTPALTSAALAGGASRHGPNAGDPRVGSRQAARATSTRG
jgi:hypothetical protein